MFTGAMVALVTPFDGGEIDFETRVVLEGVASAKEGCREPVKTALPVLLEETPAGLVIQVDAPAEGYLVISDTWYPGWKAWVDGRETPVLKANYLFRAVQVGAGMQRVTLKYQPPSFYLGVLISSLTLIILLLCWKKLR